MNNHAFYKNKATILKLFLIAFLTGYSPLSQANPAKFYANPDLQAQAPAAFALTKSNKVWLQNAHLKRQQDALRFFNALKNDEKLFTSSWSSE